ncbi:MAG: phosphoribosylaminoimidazolesuccinocarboxamide synthase [Acidobacteria bacterium]|nr:MAG: phosphoribosylaminoimidazolesuccinocarboxamide synthase [Acidobacteriota bacterium]
MTQLTGGPILRETRLPGVKLFSRGKVRDIYEAGDDRLLIVATDRLSAFDVVMAEGIPDKGRVLTQLSRFWFEFFGGDVPSHFLTTNLADYPPEFRRFTDQLVGRSMLVWKARPFPIECVVRGYLAGSGWNDYRATGRVCGIELPRGLTESARLEEPIFTPATKAQEGHDENISWQETVDRIGEAAAERLRESSLTLYQRARAYAEERGILIADTKFEWGLRGDAIILIDEVLTPDSSRFWPKDGYVPGQAQPSFDKQWVRDYLVSVGWNKQPPPPSLPREVVEKTSEKYREAYRLLTGHTLN